jgi:uncharacterized membrane protein YqjE
VQSSIERLVVASQGVITKRIDLALLEGQELVTRTVLALVLGGLGVLLACGAWFAFVAFIVLSLAADAAPATRALIFAGINAIGAAALITPAIRRAPVNAPRPHSATADEHLDHRDEANHG